MPTPAELQLSLLLAGATLVPASAFDDACTAEPGYGAFRTQLERVVAARDGDGLRALFDPDGAMRVNGVGGRGSTPDWGFGRAEAAAVWSELDEILQLGCARQGGRLVLPGLASIRDLQDDSVVLIRAEAVRTHPRSGAKAIARAERGRVLSVELRELPVGWIAVRFAGGIGYLPASSVRTPTAVRLELAPSKGGWRIRSFSDGV